MSLTNVFGLYLGLRQTPETVTNSTLLFNVGALTFTKYGDVSVVQ